MSEVQILSPRPFSKVRFTLVNKGRNAFFALPKTDTFRGSILRRFPLVYNGGVGVQSGVLGDVVFAQYLLESRKIRDNLSQGNLG